MFKRLPLGPTLQLTRSGFNGGICPCPNLLQFCSTRSPLAAPARTSSCSVPHAPLPLPLPEPPTVLFHTFSLLRPALLLYYARLCMINFALRSPSFSLLLAIIRFKVLRLTARRLQPTSSMQHRPFPSLIYVYIISCSFY